MKFLQKGVQDRMRQTAVKTRIETISSGSKQRILAVSDIHGHADWLMQVLRKAHYSKDDILVIAGDLIEKGPHSLRTIQYVMDLCKKNQVYVLMGNVELNRLRQLDDQSEGAEERFFRYLCDCRKHWGSSVFIEMLEQLGHSYANLKQEECGRYRAMIGEKFEKELSFLRGLPTILTAENYIFVHGGIPTDRIQELAGTDAELYLKNDCFMEKGLCFSKNVVVGHWPVCLYREDREDLSPYFNQKQRIISMDGGCGVKTAGQLNLLIIPNQSAAMEEIDWISYDSFPVITAKERQNPAPAAVHVNWFHSGIRRIVWGEEFSKYCHLSTGTEFFAPSKGEYEKRGELCYDDYCDAKLLVEPNDELSVINETSRGCYVKKRGKAGWYYGGYEIKEPQYMRILGRPQECKSRRLRETAVYDLLDQLEVNYSYIDHAEIETMEGCRKVEEILDAVVCKNLFLCNRSKTQFYLLMMPGRKKFLAGELSKQINCSRLSFAAPKDMERYLHIAPGAVSVMGLMNDTENKVRLFIDREILAGEYLGCHPCVNTTSIRLRMKDFLEVILPAIHHKPEMVDLTGAVN